MRTTPPRPSPSQRRQALTLPNKALRVNDFVEFCGLLYALSGSGGRRGAKITGILRNLRDSASSRRPRSRSKPGGAPVRRLREFKSAPNDGSNRARTKHAITRTTWLSPLRQTACPRAFRGTAGLRAFHKTFASLLNANLIHGRHRLDRSYFRFARSDEVFRFCSCVGRTNSEYYPRAACLVGGEVMNGTGWPLQLLSGI